MSTVHYYIPPSLNIPVIAKKDIAALIEICRQFSGIELGVVDHRVELNDGHLEKDDFVLFRRYAPEDGYEYLPVCALSEYWQKCTVLHVKEKDDKQTLYPEYIIRELGAIPTTAIRFIIKVS